MREERVYMMQRVLNSRVARTFLCLMLKPVSFFTPFPPLSAIFAVRYRRSRKVNASAPRCARAWFCVRILYIAVVAGWLCSVQRCVQTWKFRAESQKH